jgi:hypothetical protein
MKQVRSLSIRFRGSSLEGRHLSDNPSDGITDGFHQKMKLIQRRAYGFRNFEN